MNLDKPMKKIFALILIVACLPACRAGSTGQYSGQRTEKDTAAERLRSTGLPVMDVDDFVAKADSAFAAERCPGNYLRKAQALDFCGAHQAALNYTDTILAVCKDDIELICRARRLRATIYLSMGNPKKEREEYQKIIAHGYEDFPWEAMEAMARSYFHEGLYTEALAALPDSLSEEGKKYYQLIMKSLECNN